MASKRASKRVKREQTKLIEFLQRYAEVAISDPEMIATIQHLDLRPYDCRRIPKLNMLSMLQTLDLTMTMYSDLTCLPESLWQLAALQELTIRHCGMTNLSESLGQLTALQKMRIDDCIMLPSLPESLRQLAALHTLEIIYCESLTCLPESLGLLPALHTLLVCNCRRLVYLPASLGQLAALQTLITGSELRPALAGQFNMLQELKLHGRAVACLAEFLKQPELARLGRLEIAHDGEMGRLPELLGKLVTLRELRIICFKLPCLPKTLGRLTALESVHLGGSAHLRAVPGFVCNVKGTVDVVCWNGKRKKMYNYFQSLLMMVLCMRRRYGWHPRLPDEILLEVKTAAEE